MGTVKKPSGVRKRTSWPMRMSSSPVFSSVRTTPLTWGAHASVEIRIRIEPPWWAAAFCFGGQHYGISGIGAFLLNPGGPGMHA